MIVLAKLAHNKSFDFVSTFRVDMFLLVKKLNETQADHKQGQQVPIDSRAGEIARTKELEPLASLLSSAFPCPPHQRKEEREKRGKREKRREERKRGKKRKTQPFFFLV